MWHSVHRSLLDLPVQLLRSPACRLLPWLYDYCGIPLVVCCWTCLYSYCCYTYSCATSSMGKGKSWRSKPANGNVLGRIASAAKGRVATRTLVKLLSPDKRRQEKVRSDLRREDQQLWRDIGDSMRIAKTRGSHPFQLEFANPSRLIQHLLDESDWLKGLFCSTLARVPCSKEAPWGLMLAYDELTMGNVVKTIPNNRKTMSFYMTFTEFEAHLSVEEAWFSPVVLRSTTSVCLSLSLFLSLSLSVCL